MADEKQLKAEKIYNTMVDALNARNWHFEENPEKLTITSSYQGDDIPVRFRVIIDAEREVIRFISPLPFNIIEDKRVDAAIAVNVANYGMINGSFDYDIGDGEIRFRLTTSYTGCEVGNDFFMDMIATGVLTTDKYNDRFMMLSKGLMTLQDFIEKDKS